MIGLVLGPRSRAGLAAAALFLAGVVVGTAADRLWLGRAPSEAEAAPLTVRGLGRALDLDPAERARVGAVLDSLRGEVATAAEQSPESLRVVARRARGRLEEAIPADRREAFRVWMQGHHQRMMQRMGPMMRGGMPMHEMMGPEGGPGTEMMGPGMGRDSASGGGMMRRGPGRRGPGSMMRP